MSEPARLLPNFVLIADRLDVAPARAQLGALPPLLWYDPHGDGGSYLLMLGPDGTRRHEAALAEAWRLVARVHALAAARAGDQGRLAYLRAARMPPGTRVPPHADGYDGVRRRRYQIVLQSAPGAELTISGETRCMAEGEAWQLDVSRIHHSLNAGAVDRVVLMFDTWADD